jgi:tRNA threonylcarbamoyladenosine biosynthesis protein TsaB
VPNGGRTLLAIDSSTAVTGLALYDGESCSELVWNAGRNQTTSLTSEMVRLLELSRLELRDLGAIAVATGPGSFNGLRVGMSVAKGLCYGLDIPIIGVGTLDVVAYPHVGMRSPIRAFVRAGRGRAVYADYRYRNGRWTRTSDLKNEPLDSLAGHLSEKTILVGDMPPNLIEQWSTEPMAQVPALALRVRRPSYLAEIGYHRWEAGDTDSIDALEPIYVHGMPPSGVASAARN